RPRRPECAPTILVRVQVQVRAERADHERHTLVDGRIEQVADPEVDLRARERRAPRADVEHSPRRVHADDADPVGGDRNCDSARADPELDDRAARTAGPPEVETDGPPDGSPP